MKADKLAVDGSFVLLIDSCIALNDDLFVVHRASSTSAGQPRRVTTFCETVENRFIRSLDRPSRGLILDGGSVTSSLFYSCNSRRRRGLPVNTGHMALEY